MRAAGDCVVTHHRLLGTTYPVGHDRHEQGRVAEENALGDSMDDAGSLGTQVVKVSTSSLRALAFVTTKPPQFASR